MAYNICVNAEYYSVRRGFLRVCVCWEIRFVMVVMVFIGDELATCTTAT